MFICSSTNIYTQQSGKLHPEGKYHYVVIKNIFIILCRKLWLQKYQDIYLKYHAWIKYTLQSENLA